MRKTKIVCTIGPATDEVGILKELITAGMSAARINFSHGTYESHAEVIKKIKQARDEMKMPVPLLLDTKGPEIRLKTFKDEQVELIQGETFVLTSRDVEGDKSIVSISYKDLSKDVSVGSRILLDDGLIELAVRKIENEDIITEVVNAGKISSRKGVNVPDVYINLPSLTTKDIEDIKFGIEHGFDYIAASFVRSAKDVLDIKNVLDKNGGTYIDIIAKIENRDGVNNIDEILEVADGIMVARGDLGVEILPEEVPQVQKLLIKKANETGKPVITATQMLDSMTKNPRPTRAEANDVANAIYDGTDCIMLSGETAMGLYPVGTVETMSRIAEKAEDAINYRMKVEEYNVNLQLSVTNAISYATCTTANELDASCIVPVTTSGFTARMVSRFRPSCPIFAVTERETTWRKLALTWGCVPMLVEEFDKGADSEVFKLAAEAVQKRGIATTGDPIVIVAGVPVGITGTTNTIRVEIIGDILVKGKSVSSMNTVTGIANNIRELGDGDKHFKQGDILVVSRTSNELLPFIRMASAVIVGNGNINDPDHLHAETVGQTLNIPVIVCLEKVIDLIPNGAVITIDAKKGFVYNGVR
ncbi:MAG: pyruvate kinase [Lachnospirales bacterium]